MKKRTTTNAQSKVQLAETKIEGDFIYVKLPKTIQQFSSLGDTDTTFFCITNGIVQLSGSEPAVTIPPFVPSEENYLPKS